MLKLEWCKKRELFLLYNITDEVLKLKQEWERADETTRRFMEQRYGKKVIRQVIEESFSQAWLDEYSKKCPQCNTNIQVRFLFFIEYRIYFLVSSLFNILFERFIRDTLGWKTVWCFPFQKIDGCNKMTCTKCRAYFCWLCMKPLSRNNPYLHFNQLDSPCFNKLFYGVLLDDDDEWEELPDEFI